MIGNRLPRMFALFLAWSTCKCPEGLVLRDMQVFSLNLSAKKFSYFFARVPTSEKFPIRMMVKSEKPVKIAAESIAVCPNETTTPFITTNGGREWIGGQTFFRDDSVNTISIGVFSDEDQTVHVKLAKVEPVNYGKIITTQMFYIFLALILVAGIMFCYFIGSPLEGIKKPKTD